MGKNTPAATAVDMDNLYADEDVPTLGDRKRKNLDQFPVQDQDFQSKYSHQDFKSTLHLSAAEKVFSNSAVLRNIFKGASFQDLKSFRQINKSCLYEASAILHSDFSTKSLLITNSSVEYWTNYNKELKFVMGLPEFTQMFRNSSKFPCADYKLDLPLYAEISPEIQYFFSDIGFSIKSLEVSENSTTSEKLTVLEEILLTKVPHLKNLTFLGDPGRLFSDSKFLNETLLQQVYLRRLKTLTLTHSNLCQSFLQKLLTWAPNLENIYSLDDSTIAIADFLTLLLDTRAISRVKSLDLEFKEDTIDLYDRISKEKIILSEITKITMRPKNVQNFAEKVREILTRIFKNCSQTLEKISKMHSLLSIEHDDFNFKYPPLPFLSTLECCSFATSRGDENYRDPPLFFNEAENNSIFPNLSAFRVEMNSENCVNLDNAYDFDSIPQRLLSVRRIEFLDKLNSGNQTDVVRYLCQLCPNAISAKFETLSCFESSAQYIWGLECLEELELGIQVDCRQSIVSLFDVTTGFTGFSNMTVEKILEGRRSGGKFETEYERVKPSIVDLTELKKLSITFKDKRVRSAKGRNWILGDPEIHVGLMESGLGFAVKIGEGRGSIRTIISKITSKYGFQMCSNLESNTTVGFIDCYGENHPPLKLT